MKLYGIKMKAVFTIAQLCGKDVPRGDEQLLPQVGRLLRTQAQQSQQALHHLLRVAVDRVLHTKVSQVLLQALKANRAGAPSAHQAR